MALVNPQIAMSYRPTTEYQPRNALAEYAQIQQIVGAQEQQQLNALKMQEARSAAEERNALRQLNPTAPNYESQLFRVNPTLGIQYRKERVAADTAEAARQKSLAESAAARQDLISRAQRDISQRPTDANITAHLEDILASPLFTQEEKDRTQRNSARLLQMPLEDRMAFLASQGAKPGELKPQITTQDTGGRTRLLTVPAFGGEATVVPGSEIAKTLTPEGAKPVVTARTRGDIAEIVLTNPLTGETTVSAGSTAAVPLTQAQRMQDERDRERIKQEGQRIGLEGRRVRVLEENQRRDADPAFQQRMAAARVTGEAIAKGDVAAQQALPKIVSRAEEGLRLIDEMVGKQEVRDQNGKVIQPATKPHPGFQNAVGATWLPGARFVPGTDAANFMARFDQIKGASFLEAFESLKGGGAITEKEGAKATDAINRMSVSTDEKEFMSAARDLQEVIRKGIANAQRKAGGAGGAAAPVSPNIDALLQKYK